MFMSGVPQPVSSQTLSPACYNTEFSLSPARVLSPCLLPHMELQPFLPGWMWGWRWEER